MDVKAVLEDNLKMRQDEVAAYQMNIDNYELALQQTQGSQDQAVIAFREQLTTALAAERAEQTKAKVMLNVIKTRLDALAVSQ